MHTNYAKVNSAQRDPKSEASVHVCSVAQLGLILCNPPGSSVHEILQASGLPFPPPGDLPDPGIKPASLVSPAVASRFFTTESPGKPKSDA